MEVFGSWNQWSGALAARSTEPGVWVTDPLALRTGEYQYKLKVGDMWMADPLNPWRIEDGQGGINSRFRWPK